MALVDGCCGPPGVLQKTPGWAGWLPRPPCGGLPQRPVAGPAAAAVRPLRPPPRPRRPRSGGTPPPRTPVGPCLAGGPPTLSEGWGEGGVAQATSIDATSPREVSRPVAGEGPYPPPTPAPPCHGAPAFPQPGEQPHPSAGAGRCRLPSNEPGGGFLAGGGRGRDGADRQNSGRCRAVQPWLSGPSCGPAHTLHGYVWAPRCLPPGLEYSSNYDPRGVPPPGHS